VVRILWSGRWEIRKICGDGTGPLLDLVLHWSKTLNAERNLKRFYFVCGAISDRFFGSKD
jgi:hypothetical protein